MNPGPAKTPLERAEIARRLREFIESEAPDKGAIDETTDLVSAFADSMTIVSVVAFVEERFGIEMRRADINGKTFGSLRSLTDYVAARQKPGS